MPTRTRIAHLAGCGFALAAASTTLPAQSTILVGPGGLPQVTDALAVAQSGDTIVVQPGSYDPFAVGIGVRIVAPDGATIVPGQCPTPCSQPTSIHPPTGQTAYLSGLTFVAHPGTSQIVQTVAVTDGQAVFEGCAFFGPDPYWGPYELLCSHADLVLVGCSFATDRSSVRVTQGSLAATGCSFAGTNMLFPGTAWQPGALEIDNSTATLSACTLQGYDAFAGIAQPAGPALIVTGNSQVALTECTLVAGDGNGSSLQAPTPALRNNGPQPVRHANTTFTSGFGYVGFPPIWMQGPGTSGPVAAASLLGGEVLTPNGPRIGQPYSMQFTALPQSAMIVAATLALTSPSPFPPIVDAVRFDSQAILTFVTGTANGSGVLGPLTIPAMPPFAIGTPVWFHGIAFDGSVFLAAPPLGGLVR